MNGARSALTAAELIRITARISVHHFVPCTLIAVLCNAPLLPMYLWDDRIVDREYGAFALFAGWWFTYTLRDSLLVGCVSHAVPRLLAQAAPEWLVSLRLGARQAHRSLAAGFLVAGITGAGFVLLIVPGCIWAATYYVVVPAVVLEGRPLRAALGRSRQLVHGVRWQIFAVFIVFGVIVTLLDVGLQYLLVAWESSARASNLCSFALDVVVSPIFALSCLVAYHLLLSRKEGGPATALAQVFE